MIRPHFMFSRRAILVRDEGKCQYCGESVHNRGFTVDHLIPKYRGGASNWKNCVCACAECNRKKGERTPEEAGMKLVREPFDPNERCQKFGFKHKFAQTVLQAWWPSPELRDAAVERRPVRLVEFYKNWTGIEVEIKGGLVVEKMLIVGATDHRLDDTAIAVVVKKNDGRPVDIEPDDSEG